MWRENSVFGLAVRQSYCGSISNLGGQYVIGIDTVGCSSGDTLAQEQEEAASKQDVLKALGKAVASLRAKLGESLATVQKFDVPVEATTPSLEALKAYSMGITTGRTKGDAEAIPFMKRAIELDPNFAMAYVGLAVRVLKSWAGKSWLPITPRRPTTCAIG